MEVLTPHFKKVASDLPGAEGPVFSPDNKFFAVAPFREREGRSFGGDIVRIDISTGQCSEVCVPEFDGHGGVPAGLQMDRQGCLWVADMRHGVLKLNQDGSHCTRVTEEDSDGNRMQGCNDCIFDYHGNLWITAPAGEISPSQYRRSEKEPFGSVYCYTKDGEMKKIDANSYLFSNGIAVQHDSEGVPKLLIVAETGTKTLHAYEIMGPGEVVNKRIWATLPGDHEGGPDGMDFDADGNLLVANWNSSHIEVFGGSGGSPIARILCPFTQPSNLHFRPGSREVYVTEHNSNSVWMFEWRCAGMKQYCDL